MKGIKLWMMAILVAGLTMTACSEEDDQSTRVKFYLTDAPAPSSYKAVNIDLQEIKYSVDGENWKNLFITPGIVNLMDFTNGQDTLLSDIVLYEGEYISQIRLVLGDNNSVEFSDGNIYSFSAPSAQTSGLKFNVQENITTSSSYAIRIDFDASRSIVKQGNGNYSFKPVIRAYLKENTSAVFGYLSPSDIPFEVFTIMDTDTLRTLSDTLQNNYFMLHGLTTGTYDIQIRLPETKIALDTFQIEVVGGTDKDLETVVVSAKALTGAPSALASFTGIP